MVCFGCRIEDHQLHRASFFKADLVIREGFFKPDVLTGSERVIVAHQHTYSIGTEWDEVESFGRHERCNQAKVNDAVAHHTNCYLADLLVKLDLDAGIKGHKPVQHFRQKLND